MAYTNILDLLLVDENWQFADEAFNRVINDADNKLVGIDHLNSAMHWTEWEENTSYVVGDVVRWRNMKNHQYAKCTTAGISGGTSPTSNVTGSFLMDNTVEWIVCSLSSEGSNISITIWLSGANYLRGDIVLYGGAFYRCKTQHTAGIWATDFGYWQEIFASIRNWVSNIYYFEGDSCIYDNGLYYCIDAHTSRQTFDSTEDAKWLCITSGRLLPWKTNTEYVAGEFIYQDNVIYQCITDHTSDSSDFYADRDTKWKVFHTPTATIKDWAADNYYEVNQCVLHDNRLYRCLTEHTSTTFLADMANWEIEYSNIKEWTTVYDYHVGETVSYGGKLLRCNTQHTSSTFGTDASKWDVIVSSGISPWDTLVSYNVGDIVYYNNIMYKCKTAHTSGTFSTDRTNWDLFHTPTATIKDWTASEYYEVDQVVVTDNKLYRCTTANDDATFDIDNWEEINPAQVEDWVTEKSYVVNQLVMYEGNIYRANISHTSSSVDFETDKNKWDIVYASLNVWATGVYYKTGTTIINDGKIYKCNTDHLSNNFYDTTETTYWDVMSGGAAIKEWTANTNYYADDLVVYDGTLYKVDNAFTSGNTFDDTDMTPIMGEQMTDSDIDDLWI